MKINVDINNLKIIDKDQLESGEYNVTDLEFIFSPEYENLQKVAIFGCNLESEDPKYYKVILHDDKCIIPEEVLHKTGQIVIGCYAYEINGEELIRRYSPVPIKIIVEQGSFRDNFENVTPPTPSELEQIQAQINQIEAKIIIINNTLHIYDTNFQTVNEAINDINEKLDNIEGDIADTYSKQEIDDKFSEVSEALEDKVDTTVFEESQNEQDDKIDKLNLIVSQLPKVTGEGTNISLSPTIEYDLEVGYKGDTEQDTLAGKNLFNIATKKDYYWLYANGGIGESTDPNMVSDFIPTTSGQQYVISGIPSGMSLRVCSYSSTNVSGFVSALINNVGDVKTFTANSNYIVFAVGSGNAVALTELQMETGSTATSYEPYCGGIPSPNPNYPQDIQVVTGTQAITISNSDNTESQTYTLHLGDEELAKIGSYQDKIYYDNGKWYLRKEIGKVVLNGTENWELQSINSYGIANFRIILSDYNSILTNLALCDNFSKQDTLIGNTQTEGFQLNNQKYLYIRIKSSTASTVSEFKTWLSTNNTELYYVLATPSTTEITNTTLLQDLNYIKEHIKSYSDTTNISTSGNLPIIITASALKQLS